MLKRALLFSNYDSESCRNPPGVKLEINREMNKSGKSVQILSYLSSKTKLVKLLRVKK